MLEQVLACLVAWCLAVKNKVCSLSGTLVQLVISWGDPEVDPEELQFVQKQQSRTKMCNFHLLLPSFPQEHQSSNPFSTSSM